jgi:hypothetical protein
VKTRGNYNRPLLSLIVIQMDVVVCFDNNHSMKTMSKLHININFVELTSNCVQMRILIAFDSVFTFMTFRHADL